MEYNMSKHLEPTEWKIAEAIISYCNKKIIVTQNYIDNYEYPEARANIIRIRDQIEHLRRMQRN